MTDTVTPSAAASGTRSSEQLIRAEAPVLAHNYHPLPVVVARAEGAWVEDVEGRRYLDMLAGYSALNFGHRHPALIEAAHRQLDELTLTSRAFHHDRLAGFAERLAALTGLDMVLPMNTGAEAVESAVKVARKWAYEVKGVAPDRATIVVADGNFHGRTTTIVSFSTDGTARAGSVPSLRASGSSRTTTSPPWKSAVDETTAAVLIEPVQGEALALLSPTTATSPGSVNSPGARGACSSPTRSSRAWGARAAHRPSTTRAWSRTCCSWARPWAGGIVPRLGRGRPPRRALRARAR
ncbi:Ornithine aminotransferase [Streptomyces badius]